MPEELGTSGSMSVLIKESLGPSTHSSSSDISSYITFLFLDVLVILFHDGKSLPDVLI